jgi:hypothetical protein
MKIISNLKNYAFIFIFFIFFVQKMSSFSLHIDFVKVVNLECKHPARTWFFLIQKPVECWIPNIFSELSFRISHSRLVKDLSDFLGSRVRVPFAALAWKNKKYEKSTQSIKISQPLLES